MPIEYELYADNEVREMLQDQSDSFDGLFFPNDDEDDFVK